MSKKVLSRAGGTWTESRYWTFIRSALRQAWSRYPVKHQVMKAAQIKNDGRYDKRTKFMYECEKCKDIFKGSEIQVDHIIPAGSLKKYSDLPEFVKKLFCEKDNLQILCKTCHKAKTKEERNGTKRRSED